jgi:glycosyltransferase involved in cell wall biosynthesis
VVPRPADRPLRIAWLGPRPEEVGGVPSMARQMILGLADQPVDLELFLDSPRTPFLDELAQRSNVRVNAYTARWSWRRWYSSTRLTALASGTAARVHTGERLAQRLAARHAEQPFDVVYRLSQIELFALRRLRRQLPPIVLHPEVHAEGERRHHWRERSLALRCEPLPAFAVSQAYLGYRAGVQRRDLRSVARLVAPSARFADLLAGDYGFPRRRIDVLPNVIDLDRFHPAPAPPPPSPVRLLFVSRMSVRKGVEQIVELSHRLHDLAGQVRIDCLGGASLFSNYSRLLDDLNPGVACRLEALAPGDLAGLYRGAHGLLQPSWYEPYALTVGEALASGLPVIVTDEVGAGEGVDSRVCRVHAAGDIDGLEREVRRLVAEVQAGWAPELRDVARRHAEEHLSRDRFARDLVGLLSELRVAA